jgi:hypothetical protein
MNIEELSFKPVKAIEMAKFILPPVGHSETAHVLYVASAPMPYAANLDVKLKSKGFNSVDDITRIETRVNVSSGRVCSVNKDEGHVPSKFFYAMESDLLKHGGVPQQQEKSRGSNPSITFSFGS